MKQESGFLLVELLLGILVIAVGILALLNAFDSSQRLTSVGERQNVLAEAAQQQMEQVLALPYSSIALNANPSCDSTDASDPNTYVTGCPIGPFSYAWNDAHTSRETVIVDTTNGAVNPSFTQTTPAPNNGARLTLTIDTYITAATDPLCSGCQAGSFSENYKRITVAVTSIPTLTRNTAKIYQPVIVSSLAFNPCAAASSSNASCLVPPAS